MTENYEYQVGASLPPDAPSYVVRKADSDFYHALKAGKYCYVFNSRQMGKSSLKVRVMQRLVNEGVACSSIDISGQGSKDNVTQEQWYTGIVSKIVKDLQIAKPIEFRRTWWRDRNDISPVQKLDEFIEDVLLTSIPGNIIIFVDEIDSTLSLKFASEDFFALIRSCYNKRSENPAYKRLTFALLGVATPGDLIQDKTRTPFNIGEAIELDGFKIHEIEPLAKGLAEKVENSQAVMQEVLIWTGGQPFLTQRVCELLGKNLSLERRDFRSVDENKIIEFVKEIINNQIIDNWEANDKQEHLKTIRDRIIADEEVSVALLGLYQQILQKSEITVDGSPEQMRLRLTGLVVQQQGKLRVYNQIYGNVFDINWVENELGKLRPYAESFKAWMNNKYHNYLYLLRGEDLKYALAWSEDKSLSDDDWRFLASSQELDKKEALKLEKEAYRNLVEERKKIELSLKEAHQKLLDVKRKTQFHVRLALCFLIVSVVGGIIASITLHKIIKKAEQKNQNLSIEIHSAAQILKRETEKLNDIKYEYNIAQNETKKQKEFNKQLKTNIDKLRDEKQQKNQEIARQDDVIRNTFEAVNQVNSEIEKLEKRTLELQYLIENRNIYQFSGDEPQDLIQKFYEVQGQFNSIQVKIQSIGETMQVGDTKIRVANLQSCLRDLGFFHNSITGKYDSLTKKAVSNLQLKNHLPLVEFLDMSTLRVIQKQCRIATIYMPYSRLIGSNYDSSSLSPSIVANPGGDGGVINVGNGAVINIDAANAFAGIPTNGVVIEQTWEALLGNSQSQVENNLSLSTEQVSELQEHLRALGYLQANSTGHFVPLTRDALIRFQRDYRLSANGVADAQALAAVRQVSQNRNSNQVAVNYLTTDNRASNQAAKNYIIVGDSGENVKALQERLLQLGFFNANPNGYFGEITRAYVYAFQQRAGINPTGAVDAQTWQALGLNTSPIGNRSQTNRYVVVVPIYNSDTLNKVRQYIPNPVVEKSSRGDYINAGSYHDRLLAESVVRLLRTRNIDARVEYF